MVLLQSHSYFLSKVVVTSAASSLSAVTPTMASEYHFAPAITSKYHFTSAVVYVCRWTSTMASECHLLSRSLTSDSYHCDGFRVLLRSLTQSLPNAVALPSAVFSHYRFQVPLSFRDGFRVPFCSCDRFWVSFASHGHFQKPFICSHDRFRLTLTAAMVSECNLRNNLV